MLAALLVLALAAAAGAAYAWRRQSRRLRKLARIARDVAGGRVEARADPDAGAAGELAQALNLLAQRFAQARDRVKDQVDGETLKLREELSRAQQRVRSAEENAERVVASAQSRGNLLADMSHELRTPLSAILGHAELLARSELTAEQAEYADTVRRSARDLLSMIADLLDWSRIEAGKLVLADAEFALGDCVEDTIELLAPLAYAKGLELVHIVYHDVPQRLRGDEVRLKQVMTNLLSNGIKFTERGEVVLRVMKEREDAQRVVLRLQVSDTGIGIAPETLARLFQPYQQANAGARSGGGSGLGLAITRKMVELMGGTVGAQSEPGQGSTFSAQVTLALPAVLSAPPRLEGLRGLQAWLHEPHPTAQLALLHCLEYWGMAVRPFETVAELAAALQHTPMDRRPDLVLLGIRPGESGSAGFPDLFAECRALNPPLLCLVNSVNPADHHALRDAGAADVLPKSVARRSLFDTLITLTRRAAPTDERTLPLAGRRVLVADNNLANRRFIARLLQGMGADVVEAHDGLSAVQAWQQRRPEFLLLDVHMPGMDGLSAAREIRTREGAARHAVIFGISAHLEEDERRALALAGMDGELLKPFDERQLLRALSPWLEIRAAPVTPAEKSERLASDPQLLTLLLEELPGQLKDLEEAYARGDSTAVRAAAHTLHGTAAFYRLRPLKQTAQALEQRLAGSGPVEQQARLRDDIAALRNAVLEVIKDMRRQQLQPGWSDSAAAR